MEEIATNKYPDIVDKKYNLPYVHLYLLIKYRDYGILYFDELDDAFSWFCGDSNVDETGEKIIEEPYLQYPENFEENLKLHENRYLFLQLYLLECESVEESHANILIFDKETKTMSRWESNIDLYRFYKQELLDSKLEKFAKSIGYSYQTTYEVCSSNFNTIGEVAYRQREALKDENDSPLTDAEKERLYSYDLEGPCHLFVSLFIEYGLNTEYKNKNKQKDPIKSIDSTNKELIDLLLNSKYTIDEFLYKYRNYILGELHQFILEEFSYDGDYDKESIIGFIGENEDEIIEILMD
jgi:hypothetical protein